MDWRVFSKCNPMVVLYAKKFGKEDYYELARTEIIENDLNPDFVKKFEIEYYFEERQHLRFKL